MTRFSSSSFDILRLLYSFRIQQIALATSCMQAIYILG